MKNKLFMAVIASIIVIAGCKKTALPDGGFWIFKSQKYTATYTNFINDALFSYSGPNYPTGSVAFTWTHVVITYDTNTQVSPPVITAHTTWVHSADSIFPKSGTYIVTNNIATNDSNYVYVYLTDTSAANLYNPISTSTSTLSVTRDGNLISVSLPSVQMITSNGDSGLLSANVKLTPRK